MGLVMMNDIRNIMFRPELYDRFTVQKFMVGAPAQININSTMEEVMDTFENTKAWNLPVVDNQGVYQGILSQSSVFNSYREVLVDTYSCLLYTSVSYTHLLAHSPYQRTPLPAGDLLPGRHPHRFGCIRPQIGHPFFPGLPHLSLIHI